MFDKQILREKKTTFIKNFKAPHLAVHFSPKFWLAETLISEKSFPPKEKKTIGKNRIYVLLSINDFDTITKSPKPTLIWPKSYLRILYRFFNLRKLKTKALKDLQSSRIPHYWQMHPYGHLDQWLASFNIISMQCKEKFSYNHLFFSIRNKNLPFFSFK